MIQWKILTTLLMSSLLVSAAPNPSSEPRTIMGNIDRVIVGGGGGIVGNGAGLVEFEFQQAKHVVDRILGGCFPGNPCRFEIEDLALAERILALVRSPKGEQIKVEIISGKKNPGFFNTGEDEFHRIAKTTLTAGSPIFVNSDLLYGADGQPSLSFGQVVGLVVHELGHQTGEHDHRKLDRIGAEVARMLQGQSFYYSYKGEMGGAPFQLGITNLAFPAQIPLIVLFGNERTRNLTATVTRLMKCQAPNSKFIGYEVANGHFSVPETLPVDGKVIYFNAWLRVKCHNPATQSWSEEIHSLRMTIDEARDIETLTVNPIRF